MSEGTRPVVPPPPLPWVRGKHPEYTCVAVQVLICQDAEDRVWSLHGPETPEDNALALDLPGAGVQQIGFALLQEAARQEAFVEALIKQTTDSTFVQSYADAPAEIKLQMEHELANSCISVLTQTLGRMLPGSTREILTMMANSLRDQSIPDKT